MTIVLEHLNETGQFGDGLIVRGTNLLVVDTIENSARIHRSVGERVFLPAMKIFHRGTTTPEEYTQSYNVEVGIESLMVLLCCGDLFSSTKA